MRAMSDPLKKLLEDEQKKIDAKLQYRSSSQGEIKLPDVLPNLYPFMPKTETPTWTNLITAQDSADVNVGAFVGRAGLFNGMMMAAFQLLT